MVVDDAGTQCLDGDRPVRGDDQLRRLHRYRQRLGRRATATRRLDDDEYTIEGTKTSDMFRGQG